VLKPELDFSAYKSLVALAIEKALMGFGVPEVDTVQSRLQEKYNYDFTDCLEHPGHLNLVLKTLYGNSSGTIIKSINNYLKEFYTIKSLENFLVIINK